MWDFFCTFAVAKVSTIETSGGVTIIANGFSRSDANAIVNLLNR